MVPSRLLALALLAAALGVSACGGGSTSGGSGRGTAGGGGGATGQSSGAAGASGAAAGRGSTSGPGAGSPVGRAPRSTFIRNADRVCRRAHVKLARLGHELFGLVVATGRKRVSMSDYYARASALTRTSAAVAGRAVAELRSLPRPADRRLETYLALSAAETQLVAGEAAALSRHDGHAVHRLDARARKLVVQSRALARSIGFHECGGK